MKENIVCVFSEWLRVQLAKNRITQRDLAAWLGISEVSMSRYVNGTRFPRSKEMQKLLDYFNYHIEFVQNYKR